MGGSARAVPDASEGEVPLLGASLRSRSTARRDPLALILGTGDRWDIISVGVGIALALHVGLLVFALVIGMLKDMHDAVADGRVRLHDYFFRQYEVEVVKPKEAPPPEPPPEPEPPPPLPSPVAKAPKPVDDDPYKDVAPPPSKAAKVLTAEAKPDEPVALDGFVSGEGSVLGGQQSGDGKGDQMTMARRASLTGVEGHRGTAAAPPPPPPPPTEDHSRPLNVVGGLSWNCPFPPEADADQIDQAMVPVNITVGPDGKLVSVSVVSDPGHGFGRAARSCALGKRFEAALDRSGTPIAGSRLVNVRFNR